MFKSGHIGSVEKNRAFLAKFGHSQNLSCSQNEEKIDFVVSFFLGIARKKCSNPRGDRQQFATVIDSRETVNVTVLC